MSAPFELFRHCPRCGTSSAAPAVSPFSCKSCGLLYYFNPAIAVAAILRRSGGQVLFIRRAKEPARGKLAVPGGFVDLGETAEEALRREIREEVNLEVEALEFLCSQPNQYLYRDITYPVLDLFFVTTARSIEGLAALDGVESYCWLDPRNVAADDIAFPSIRAAFESYQQRPLPTIRSRGRQSAPH